MQTRRLNDSQPPMASAVDWFVGRAADGVLDLSSTLVATPGARAGRVLGTLLARACQDRGLVLFPPQTTTAGRLAESLAPTAQAAGPLHTRLAWQSVLRAAEADVLWRVLPDVVDPAAWAQEIGGTIDELARAGLRAVDVAQAELPPLEDPERWQALAELQGRYEALLDRAGFVDSALHAIDAGDDVAAGLDAIVLLGCMDLPGLARRMLRVAACPVHVLAMLDRGLHPDGVVDESYWRDASIDVDPDAVFVTGDAEAQGTLAIRAAVDLDTSAIGTADEALAGPVRRAAATHGLSVHVAWGKSIGTSGPARLLGDIAVLLRERSFEALARVLRSPIVVTTLAAADPRFGQLPRAMDNYLQAALPTRAFATLPAGNDHAARPREIVERARRRLAAMLRPLREKPRPLHAWAEAIERTLVALLEPSQDHLGTTSLEAVGIIGEQLRTLSRLPDVLESEPAPAHAAIDLVLAQLETSSSPAEPGGEDLDVLGWLELPLDPSPSMVVLGAHHSSLPATRAPGSLMTEGLRRALGLPGEHRTLARDAANMVSLLGGGRHVRFVLGSVDAAGESLLPSTLLLRGSGDGPARMLARVREGFATPPAEEAPPACGYRVGVMRETEPIASMSVTSFRTFLESPYQFYLRHVLGLREASAMPAAARLDASRFGTLLHEALRRFGADVGARDITDEAEIRRLMHAGLWEAAEQLTGPVRSAMTLAQIDAAERRLEELARVEAQRRAAGWRTLEVEWSPESLPILAQTGVVLRGTIDRIDYHAKSGAIALYDYKTSNTAHNPRSSHRKRDGAWRDLQLPLYEVLARPLAAAVDAEQIPLLGYISLAGSEVKVQETGWTEEDLAEAHACAVDIATRVRSGLEAMADIGSPRYDGPHARLAGIGMLLDEEHLDRMDGVRP